MRQWWVWCWPSSPGQHCQSQALMMGRLGEASHEARPNQALSPGLADHPIASWFLRSGQLPQETRCQLRLTSIQEAGGWAPASSTVG